MSTFGDRELARRYMLNFEHRAERRRDICRYLVSSEFDQLTHARGSVDVVHIQARDELLVGAGTLHGAGASGSFAYVVFSVFVAGRLPLPRGYHRQVSVSSSETTFWMSANFVYGSYARQWTLANAARSWPELPRSVWAVSSTPAS